MDIETYTILLVDENPEDVQMIKGLLDGARGARFHLQEASAVAVGLEYLTAGNIDAVLLDLSRPDSQGLGPKEKLQFLDYFNVPIIILTGSDELSLDVKALRSGAQDYLVKGAFDSALLSRVIRQAMERKGTERKLQEAQKYLKNIINSSIDMIIAFDAEWKITEFNPAAEKALGYQHDEAMGMASKALFADVIQDMKAQHEVKWEGQFSGEVLNRRKDGSSFPSLLSTSALHDDLGNIIGYLSLARDITKQKQQEAEIKKGKEDAERLNRELMRSNAMLAESSEKARKMAELADLANQAKSDFLANMSHEIRTPMNAILGMSELLAETELTDDQAEFARIIRTAGQGLLGLINDILDLSKIEAGQLSLEYIDFELAEVTGGVKDIFFLKARQKGLELSCHLAPGVPRFVSGDPVRLKQILINLLGNAIKFTSEGSLEIVVMPYPEPARSDFQSPWDPADKVVSLLFQVIDTGIGIPPDKVENIFGSFSQTDSSTTRKYGGTGLGLTISKRLVEMMGGRIWVESEIGHGSTFFFTARFAVRTSAAATEEAETAKVAAADVPPLKILLAEDSEDNRKLIFFYLRKAPHVVDVAVNGQEAVDMFKQADYDLVLMDMQMPIMDGHTATRTIRKWERETGREPTTIAALTASALEQDRQKCLESGCDTHLTKPIKKITLLSVLTRFAQSIQAEGRRTAAELSGVVQPEPGPSASPPPEPAPPAPEAAAQEPAAGEPIKVVIDIDLEDLVPDYVDNRRADVARLTEALEAKDYETIWGSGHKMKGSGAGYGFDRVTEIGKHLELAEYLDRLEIVYE